jgi:HEAT repeat protein
MELNSMEKNWIVSFESANTTRILRSIYEIRNSGSVNILPALFDLIQGKTEPQVKNEIINLVSEIKTKNAVPLIAEALNKNEYGDYLNGFVAACWQSGLDFSKHLQVFFQLFSRGDYKTALEAFTVIEEALVNATQKEIDESVRFLKEAENQITEDKIALFTELKKVVESY